MLHKSILSPEIKFILFDLDDTLIGSERIYQKIYDELKLDLAFFQQARNEVKLQLKQSNCSVLSHSRLLYFKKYLELRNQFSADSLLRLNETYETLLRNEIKKDLDSTGHIEVLQKLSEKYPLGLITNENLRTQLLKVQRIDPNGKIFRFLMTSEEVGVEKPHDFIIMQALKKIGMAAEQILMVGDSLKNDLLPFSQRGCVAIGTRQFRNESNPQDGFHWLENLRELI